MNNKKAQASMEFLMTYGWAILAAVIAIGVLAYFGVFSPGDQLPSICTLSAPLGCDEYAANSTGDTAIIIVRNGAGSPITISSFALTDCTTNSTSVTIADGGTESYDIDCSGANGGAGLAAGEKFNQDITITYKKVGKTLSEVSTGDFRVEARAL